ncbi:MAG: protein kinase [Myxococcaceae bacterium]|nr:protein kinase [Myxococcaceae bacterium]
MKNEELNPQFRIRSPLRCDGIGRLDCAEDTESGARLAVRWLPLDAGGDAAVRACAKLPEHPTLPRVRQTGQVGDKAFLAMEFPDGELLSARMGEPQKPDALLDIGAQLADALATIHSQAVVHGELSAESVLLANNKAFLWDMPLVIANRLTDRRGEERLMHMLVRTAAYLAPERARGSEPSVEGDVYGLAAVICLAAGAPMPPTGTTLSLVHAIVSGSWSVAVPAVFHEPYKSLLARMLDREPSKRPGAREVADLLGKPAAAVPTIPEMPAIVLPKGAVPVLAPRPAPRAPLGEDKPTPSKTHLPKYTAAPGALEPMLPPKAVADAAVKAAQANHKPLAVTVPTQVEPTVKVSVPVGVLVAMSQPIAVDAELKQVVDSLRPVLASDPIATIPSLVIAPAPTTTLEFGTATPAAAPKKEKTPPPALAPTAADVKAALEETEGPALVSAAKVAAEEVKAAAVTAPNPPPIPKRQSREMPTPPMVAEVFEGPKTEADAALEAKLVVDMQVQENIAVSGETYAAGAAVLDDDFKLTSWKPTMLIAAAVLAVVTTGLAAGLRAVVSREASAPAKVSVVAPVSAATLQPAQPAAQAELVEAGDEDELLPLPNQPKRAKGARKAAPAAASKLEGGKYDAKSDTASPAPLADDFSFLNSGAEAPKEDLKRPEF